jgi:NAD(P)-dependent dehydrogenase (short-subunit alcohol dehydrogenase family)
MDPTSPGRLQGRVAVVTGGSSGLGRAGALRFAQEGARVAIGSLQPDEGAAVVTEIEAAGGEATFRKADVRQPDDVAALIADTEKRWGRLDVLYASAGVMTTGTAEETSRRTSC